MNAISQLERLTRAVGDKGQVRIHYAAAVCECVVEIYTRTFKVYGRAKSLSTAIDRAVAALRTK